MLPVAIPDATTVPAPGQRPAPSGAIRWTWQVNRQLPDQVIAHVAGAYDEWGTAEHQADLLAELAADLVATVLDAGPSPYVAVTAMCQGSRATISAIPAQAPALPVAVPVPHGEMIMESSGGYTHLTAGLCAYAAVNLLTFRRAR